MRFTREQLNQLKQIPAENGYPVIGNLHRFGPLNRLSWLKQMQEIHGDVFRLKLFNRHLIVVASADEVQRILKTEYKIFTKDSVAFEKVKKFLGNGLVTNEGTSWLRQRRLMQPAFHQKTIGLLADEMISCINRLLARFDSYHQRGASFELGHEMMSLTMDVVVKTLFGSAFNDRETARITQIFNLVLQETNRRILFPIRALQRIPTRASWYYDRHIEELNEVIQSLIHKRRNSGEEHNDLLQMLLDAQDEETGAGMSDVQLRDEIMTLFLAGHETTGTALSWTLLLLDRHPEWWKKVAEEVDQVLGIRTPEASDYNSLEITRRVIYEAMRLYPPVPLLVRSPQQPFQIGNYTIPKGAQLLPGIFLLHRDKRHWVAPDSFNPNRFLKENEEARHPFAFIPFSAGPRVCIGFHFATMEAVFTLAMVVQRFRVQIDQDYHIQPDFTFTLRPKAPVMATVKPRY